MGTGQNKTTMGPPVKSMFPFTRIQFLQQILTHTQMVQDFTWADSWSGGAPAVGAPVHPGAEAAGHREGGLRESDAARGHEHRGHRRLHALHEQEGGLGGKWRKGRSEGRFLFGRKGLVAKKKRPPGGGSGFLFYTLAWMQSI